MWDEIVVPVKYGSDRRQAREILERAAAAVVGEYMGKAREAWSVMVNNYLVEDAVIDPVITLVANDDWLEYTLRYVVDFKKRRITKDRLFNHILDEMDRTVGIASMTVHLVETPVFDVRVHALEKP